MHVRFNATDESIELVEPESGAGTGFLLHFMPNPRRTLLFLREMSHPDPRALRRGDLESPEERARRSEERKRVLSYWRWQVFYDG